MGFSISDLRSSLEFARRGYFDNMEKVLDMGSQEIHIKKKDFIEITKSFKYSVNLDKFPNILKDNWPNFPRESTKSFWKMLGFKKTDCSDVNNLHNSIYLDLNKPLNDENLKNKYDLVTDFGNNEHPFNVAEAYRTMHSLCRKEGLLWINQCLIGGNGFYNFDISFFEIMAAVNNYEILSSCFILPSSNDQIRVPLSMELINLLDLNKVKEVGVSYLFRKKSGKDFIYPVQRLGEFGKDITYKSAIEPETTHLGISQTRSYIPTEWNPGFKKLLNLLFQRIKQKVF